MILTITYDVWDMMLKKVFYDTDYNRYVEVIDSDLPVHGKMDER